jgi:hypothetical protein
LAPEECMCLQRRHQTVSGYKYESLPSEAQSLEPWKVQHILTDHRPSHQKYRNTAADKMMPMMGMVRA